MVLLFRPETWVLKTTTQKKLEGVHVGFLRQVVGMTAQNLGVNTWQKEGTERLLQAIGTKPLQEYIEKRQATVAD